LPLSGSATAIATASLIFVAISFIFLSISLKFRFISFDVVLFRLFFSQFRFISFKFRLKKNSPGDSIRHSRFPSKRPGILPPVSAFPVLVDRLRGAVGAGGG
jgi:hypothetical protein